MLIMLVLSALAVALQMIDGATQGAKGNPLKYDRRVIIVTDGRGEMDTDDLEQITMKIKDPAAPIEIVLLGVDFDDDDSGYKEENKEPQKVHGLPTSQSSELTVSRRKTKESSKALWKTATATLEHSLKPSISYIYHA